MKTILIVVLLGVIYILYLDDHSKRAALDQAQEQIDSQSNMAQQVQSLTAERDRLTMQLNRTSNSGSWFQQRLNAAPILLNGTPH